MATDERSFWAAAAGIPAGNLTINDLKYAALKAYTGLSGTINDLEAAAYRKLLSGASFFNQADYSGYVTVRTNLAANPAAISAIIANGTLGWVTRWGGSGGAASNTWTTGASDGPAGLTSYVRRTWTTAPTNGTDVGFQHSAAFVNGSSTTGLPVTAGTVYTFSSYLRSSVTTGSIFQVYLYWHDSSGALIGSRVQGAATALTANTWTRVTTTAAAPLGATTVEVMTSNASTPLPCAVGDTLDGTELLIEKSAIVLPYFDGSYSPNSRLTPAWLGASNASPSVLKTMGTSTDDLVAAYFSSLGLDTSQGYGFAKKQFLAGNLDTNFIWTP